MHRGLHLSQAETIYSLYSIKDIRRTCKKILERTEHIAKEKSISLVSLCAKTNLPGVFCKLFKDFVDTLFQFCLTSFNNRPRLRSIFQN